MNHTEIFGTLTTEEVRAMNAKASQLPAWVKCMYCGGRPKVDDLLGEVVPNSTALAHQSCMRQRGKIFGMNTGTLQEMGDAVKAPEEAK